MWKNQKSTIVKFVIKPSTSNVTWPSTIELSIAVKSLSGVIFAVSASLLGLLSRSIEQNTIRKTKPLNATRALKPSSTSQIYVAICWITNRSNRSFVLNVEKDLCGWIKWWNTWKRKFTRKWRKSKMIRNLDCIKYWNSQLF